MHEQAIDWLMWVRNRGPDVRDWRKMFAPPDGGGRCYCHLCEQPVEAWKRVDHHRSHMAELDARLAGEEKPIPKPDSVRRSQQRSERRREAVEQAKAFKKDPYVYAVDRVEQDRLGRKRPVTRRRLRHPKAETIARVDELLALGRMPLAIADELRLSLNYTRRLIRLLEARRVGNAAL
jgi:hypothetical protein